MQSPYQLCLGQLSCPFYRGETGSEQKKDVPLITQLVSDRAGTKAQECLVPKFAKAHKGLGLNVCPSARRPVCPRQSA